MTPYHLHALSAAWSLRAARAILVQRVDRERATRGQDLVAAGPLRSPVWGVRHATGGHADPTGGSAERPAPPDTTWADLLHQLDKRVGWLAGMLRQTGPTPLAAITAVIPRLMPATARVAWMHLRDEDRWVRDTCRLVPARRDLTGVSCPRCGQRRLQVQTAGLVEVWTVICGADCRCVGAGCPCGMPGAVEGAPHIWPRAQVLASA